MSGTSESTPPLAGTEEVVRDRPRDPARDGPRGPAPEAGFDRPRPTGANPTPANPTSGPTVVAPPRAQNLARLKRPAMIAASVAVLLLALILLF